MRCGIVVNVTGPPPTIDRRYHDAVIVGLDNVVDKATRVHAAAWTKFLDDYLTRRPQRTGEDHCPLTHDDYRRFLAGKPDGVADFLAARGIRLPPGSPTDLTDDTVYGLQNLERQTFLQLLNTGVPEGKSIASFARRLQVAGVRVAAHTSHRNYGHTLDATGLAEVFAVFVDGAVTAELGLPAEPNPAGLIETAKRLGANPGRCVVIDSCQTGLRAGRNGGFALVIAVDAHGDAENLLSSGADAVVADLAAVTVGSGDAAISTIPDALQVYSQLKRLLTGRRPAVFLDFDGTLSDIVERPEAATLVDGAAEALRALAAQCPVAVISGRDLADVRNRVKVDGLWLAGSHGFELVAPDGSHHQNAAATAAIDGLAEAAAQLADALREIAGAVVEHKRFAVAVHYRNVADDSVDNLIAAVRRLGHAAGLRVTTGRKVVELRPDIAWDKGKALDWIGERLGPAEVGPDLRLPIYIGDDLTDEDAFDAVRFTGVGIVVRHNEHGDRRSAATFRLECPYTVCQFLSQLACDLQEAVQHDDPWTLVFHGYDPGQERLREALCAVGNGYLGSRGCAPESAESEAHYPGTYVAGVYNQLTDHIEGCTVDNESLVNLPNWLSLTFRIDGGAWFNVDTVELLSYRQTFDLRRATLTRSLRFRDAGGRVTTMTQERFASMNRPNLVALQTRIESENWSGTVDFRSLVDGGVHNTLVDRYRQLSSQHLTTAEIEVLADSVLLRTQTSQSGIAIAVAARSTLWRDGQRVDAQYRVARDTNRGGHDIQVTLSAGQSVTLEKVATIFTSRDAATLTAAISAQRCLGEAGRYAELCQQHVRAWARLWERCAIDLTGNTEELRLVRLHLLHLLQTISPHTAELDAGVPARGLNGEAYRGHVFWDALFVAPVLSLRMPKVARSLLDYRYRRLPAARRAAHRAGHLGAMYPWQSGSDGSEVSQQLHLNPRSGRWTPDPSDRAHHVGLAVAYNAWHYYQVTGDRQYLVDCGAELLVEIARFWVGLAKLDDSRALPDPGSNRSRRIPFGVSRQRVRRNRQQCVHQRDGGMGDPAGNGGAGPATADRSPPSDRKARADNAGARPMGRREPTHVRSIPRRRDQPVRGLFGTGGTGLGSLSAPIRKHPTTRPDPGSRGRQREQLPGVQASRRADAALPAVFRRADRPVGPAWLPLRAHTNPRHRGLLSCPHLGWIYPERCRACVGSRPRQPEQCHGVLPSGPALRYRRRPGRHNPGRNSPGGHGWQHRPAAALLFRIGTARRPAGVEPAMAGSTWTT